MRHAMLGVFVVALGLMTGCACMTCPMCKKSAGDANFARYQAFARGNGDVVKIDTVTGEVYVLEDALRLWKKTSSGVMTYNPEKGWEETK